MLDLICSLSKVFVNTVFYVLGQPLNVKDTARFPNVKTMQVPTSYDGAMVIDLDLPPLLAKGNREQAVKVIEGFDVHVLDKIRLYCQKMHAGDCIIASRVYEAIPKTFAYSYMPHALAGFYSTVDWATMARPELLPQLRPITVNWTDRATGKEPRSTQFWNKSYKINRDRTFYALTLSGVQGLMSWEDKVPDPTQEGKFVFKRRYLTNFYKEYTGEQETVEQLTPAEIALTEEAEEHRSDDAIVSDDILDLKELADLTFIEDVPSSTMSSVGKLPSSTDVEKTTLLPIPKSGTSTPKKEVKAGKPVVKEEIEMLGAGSGNPFGDE